MTLPKHNKPLTNVCWMSNGKQKYLCSAERKQRKCQRLPFLGEWDLDDSRHRLGQQDVQGCLLTAGNPKEKQRFKVPDWENYSFPLSENIHHGMKRNQQNTKLEPTKHRKEEPGVRSSDGKWGVSGWKSLEKGMFLHLGPAPSHPGVCPAPCRADGAGGLCRHWEVTFVNI